MGGSVPALPGIKAEAELTQRFRREVADLLGRKSLSFPGAQPVSFARKHITALQTEEYGSHITFPHISREPGGIFFSD